VQGGGRENHISAEEMQEERRDTSCTQEKVHNFKEKIKRILLKKIDDFGSPDPPHPSFQFGLWTFGHEE